MTESLVAGAPVINLTDDRLAYDQETLFQMERGAQKISYQQYQSQQSNSSNSLQFAFQSPDPSYGMVRRVTAQIPIQITAAGSTPDGSSLIKLDQGLDSFQAYPLQQITTNINMNLNGAVFNFNQQNECAPAMLRYAGDSETSYIDSYALGVQDKSQLFSDLTGAAMNPLNTYEDSTYGNSGRGAYNKTLNVTTNTSTSFIATGYIYGDLMLSPLDVYDQPASKAIRGITQVQINMIFDTLTKAWSHSSSSNSTISSFAITIAGSSLLYVLWLQPPANVAVPRLINYGYAEVVPYVTSTGVSINPNAQFQVTTNTIQLKTIPRRIYIFAARQYSDTTYLTTRTFASLLSLNVSFMGVTGVLSNASPMQLYQLAIKNGLKNISFLEWQATVGSVICIDSAQDLQLIGPYAPGISGGQYSLSIQATFQNICSQAITFATYIVVVNDGILQVQNFAFQPRTGIFTPQELAAASNEVNIPVSHKELVGGNFLGSLASGLGKLFGFLKDTKLISTVAGAIPHPLAQGIATGAKAVGLGRKRGMRYGGALMAPSDIRAQQQKYGGGQAFRPQRHEEVDDEMEDDDDVYEGRESYKNH